MNFAPILAIVQNDFILHIRLLAFLQDATIIKYAQNILNQKESMGVEKIYEYLKEHGLTQKDLAFKCKLTPQGLSTALKRGKISAYMADKLDMHTKGMLKFDELTDDPRPKKALRRKGYKKP